MPAAIKPPVRRVSATHSEVSRAGLPVRVSSEARSVADTRDSRRSPSAANGELEAVLAVE
jgi:hypothetical protein